MVTSVAAGRYAPCFGRTERTSLATAIVTTPDTTYTRLWAPRYTAEVPPGIETRDSLKDIGASTTLGTRPSAKTVRTGPFSTVWATAGGLLKNMVEAINAKQILIR